MHKSDFVSELGLKMALIYFLFLLFVGCSAKPDGAPTSACSSMTPFHSDGIPIQRSDPPYTVKAVKSGEKVKVAIMSPYGEEFEGFMLQARSKNDKKRLVEGTFSSNPSVSKAIDCSNGKKNTLTHVNASAKIEIVTDWTPSNGINEEVIFRATVAKTYALFWTEIDSSPVKVESGGHGSLYSDTHSNSGRMASNSPSMYAGCGRTRGCFGYPRDCVGNEDCVVLLSYSKVSDGILYRMDGFIESREYMAMGLSTDARMGDDSVTECLREGSNVNARGSYNQDYSNGRTRNLPRESYDGSFADGLTSCSWTSPFLTHLNGRTYNLENSTYHVLVAKGQVSNGNLGYHGETKLASGSPISFTTFDQIGGSGVSDAIKVHGAFMVTAWIGFVSLGILLARHFKNTWENSVLCGVKIWFALHRGFMITALVLVVIAFIVIFVHKNGWNYHTSNPHAILGCIATALGLFQPIMAAFRPAPDHPKRIVFNLLHLAVGNSAQIIAVVTIFFAASLESSGLKVWSRSFNWVMAIFVIVHVLFHLMLQVHSWTSAKKKNTDLGMNEMSGTARAHNIAQNLESKNITNNVFRILLLGIYGIFLLVIILVLYAIIGIA